MIENIELRAFVLSNIALARTLVIKNEDLATLDNTLMAAHYGLKAGSDKSKWRYYLNLNGEYHATDEIMTIRSLDDNENIAFTKNNLELYPATKKAYRLGSYYFSRLVAKYPHQMGLIQGIINPIPPEESIPAANYTILRYTKDYVEWNESQLIPKLQEHIDGIVYQSFNTEYKYTDDLMLPFLVGHLHSSVVTFLLQNRFENRFTRHAHSFYIWSHLRSRGISPIYKDLLNNKQTMWLFRNIDWVLRNLGKNLTFKSLISILLSERNIPLAKYDLIQSTEFLTEKLHTDPLFYSERLNLIATKGLGQTNHTIAITMNKEIPEALDNDVYYDKYLQSTVYESTFGEITNYPTKILNSELVDTTNSKPETFFNVLNNELIYLAGKNLYNINLDIEDPVTGSHQRISVKDAIVLWYYLMNRYNGHTDCDKIPAFYYKDVMKITPPTAKQMAAVGAKPFLNEAWCQDALKLHIPQIKMVSPSIFYENALNIFHTKWKHKKMYSRWLSIGYYSRRKNAISMIYETGFMKLTTKKTYTDFLKQYEFNFDEYEKENFFALMWEIWKKMTGWDQFSHITLSQIQDGMISLMRFLSSYTVQYIHQTKVEEGWYEVGLDLFTENPSLLSQTEEDGQPELENGVESDVIPVHHRVVAMDNDMSEDLYIDSRFDFGTTEKEEDVTMTMYETPRVYDVELSDTDEDNGFYSNQVIQESYKLRVYSGAIPNDIDALIPVLVSEGNQHVLKEMIVKQFKGARSVGPWTVTDCHLVDNGLDNQNVANDVDGFPYSKIEKSELGNDTNLYMIGFVPSLQGESTVKIELSVYNSTTKETVPLRFDYVMNTNANSWALQYDIPGSVSLNAPFTITPIITGLSLSDKKDISYTYALASSVKPYMTIDNSSGELKGTFIKENWPKDLPMLCTVLAHEKQPDNELLSRHYYFMKGLIPSDRYYDPTTDPAFIPTMMFSEADLNAITLERFTVQATSGVWTATDLYIKKTNGKYPTSQIKVDYAGIENFFISDLNKAEYIDTVVDGVKKRTFDFFYAIAKAGVTLDMVLELTSTDGSVVLREFQYKPTVVDHGAVATYDILPSAGYQFGVRYKTETRLTVNGLGSGITLKRGVVQTVLPNQKGNITITLDSTKGVGSNVVNGYTVAPSTFWDDGVQQVMVQDMSWAVQIEGEVKAKNGKTLTLRPYGQFTIPKDNVVDYDIIDVNELAIKGWGQNTIMTSAIVPTRFSAKSFSNGWSITSANIDKIGSSYPDVIATRKYTQTNGIAIDNILPTATLGTKADGNQTLPSGYTYWLTLYILGNEKVVGETSQSYTIPLSLTVTNKYTNATRTVKVNVSNAFMKVDYQGTTDKDELYCNEKNTVKPTWKNVPLLQFGNGATLVSSVGAFFGTERYNGGTGYKEPTTTQWNSDNTFDITLPPSIISNGQGIRVYNTRVYQSSLSAYAGTSLEKVTYYLYVDFTNAQVNKVPVPKLEDFDFTPLGNTTFYQGVRSSYVTLMNTAKVYEYKWFVNKVELEVVGRPDQDDYIITSVDGVDLSSHLLKGALQANAVHDAPAGKTKYGSTYVSFVPAKEGKQTFGVLVTVANGAVGVESRTYRYEIEIDVQPNEGKAIYDSKYPDPWWLFNTETFVLTDMSEYTGSPTRKTLVTAVPGRDASEYMSIRASVNTPLSTATALAVTVTKKFSDVTPQATVIHNLYFSGYYNGDVRATRFYIGQLPIRADRIYDIEDITIDTVEFKPDVVFNPMNVFESYIERYVYNKDTRGWTVSTVRLQDDKTWMNHYFEYENALVSNAQLFSATTQNKTVDKLVNAPEGKQFYLPKYGSRKVGTYTPQIVLKLNSVHHKTATVVELTYRSEKRIVASSIKLALTYNGIYLGEKVNFGGGLTGIPSPDVNPATKAYTTTIQTIGDNSGYFTPGTQPLSVTTAANYNLGSGNGVKIGVAVAWTGTNSGKVVESETWYRAYHGEQIIPESDITLNPANFNIKPMGVYFQEMQSATEFIFFNKSWNGWEVKGIDFKEGYEDEYVLKDYNGVDLTTPTWYLIESTQAVSINTDSAYSRLKFVPKKAGNFTYPLVLIVQKGNLTVNVPFTIEMEVKPRREKIPYLITQTAKDGKALSETNPLKLATNNSCRVFEDDIDANYVVYQSTNGVHALSNYSNPYLTVSLGVKGTTGYTPATIKPLKAFTDDVVYYHSYDSAYSLTRYGDIYNPSTIKYTSIAEMMETTFKKSWIASE